MALVGSLTLVELVLIYNAGMEFNLFLDAAWMLEPDAKRGCERIYHIPYDCPYDCFETLVMLTVLATFDLV